MSTRERIKEYIKKNYPEWDGNEDFLVNVETLYDEESVYIDDNDEDTVNELIKESVLGSINDYEDGITDF